MLPESKNKIKFPDHMFISECDGALHDTRKKGWHTKPLRASYKRTFSTIQDVSQLKATLRAGEYAFPGAYPLYLYTRDAQALHFECVLKEFRGAIQSILWNAHDRIIGCDINYEDDDLYCGYCDKPIESAYGEDEDEDTDEDGE